MKSPFEFIEYKITHRDEFDVTNGRQPTYAFLFLKEGSFRLKVDGKEETVLRKGDCAIFSDDVDFSRSVLEPISFVYIKFRPDRSCTFTLPFSTGKVIFRNKHRLEDTVRAYERIVDSTDTRSVYYKQHLLEDILFQLFYEQNSDDTSRKGDNRPSCNDASVREAVSYIRSNLSQRLTVESICHATGTNPTTLNFKFRRELSCSVWSFVTEERLRSAKKLLAGTTFSIGEIAHRCGYENIYYFSTAFRKAYRLSPTEFRRGYR